MGSNSSTRRITVINEDTAGVIRISEAASRKLIDNVKNQTAAGDGQSNQPNAPLFAAPMETLTLRKQHEEQLGRIEASWSKQKAAYEAQNRELWRSTTSKLASDLTEIEGKYMKHRRYDPICPDKEQMVEECYRKHPNQALKCSTMVKDFVGCVDAAKRAALVAGR